ncbi:unnamed protein product [Durusdinium trenchii]|uniref:Uncharacterized protein n=1 Tax=Durusdinium trenchii TaxID=1381693 RepID=A0ABP0J9B5_9DINO
MPDFRNPNAEWHLELEVAMDALRGHFGADLEIADAMPLAVGALNAPLNVEDAQKRLASAESGAILLSGGCNCLWGSPTASNTPSVKINVEALKQAARNQWGNGAITPLLEPVDFIVKENGEYQRVSPEEPVQGLVWFIAERIGQGADEQELGQWKKVLLSGPGRIMKLDGFDDIYFHSVNRRRRTADTARSIVHLASQVCCDVWLFRKRKEAALNRHLSNAEVAEMYKAGMADCQQDEEPRSDESVIQKACVVYEKVLAHEKIWKLIQWTESQYGTSSPFNSINKLNDIQAKCGRQTTKLEFFFSLACFGLKSEQIEVGDLSAKKLKGTAGRSGMIDVIMMKKQMRDYLTGRWLDEKNLVSDGKQAVRKIFGSVEAYQEEYLENERTWLSLLPPSCSKVMDLVEYCFSFDSSELPSVRNGIKAGKTAEEVLAEYQPYKTLIEEVDGALTTESGPKQAAPEEMQENADAQTPQKPAAESSSSGPLLTIHQEGIQLESVEEGWLAVAERTISKQCCLIVEKGLTQNQLQTALQRYSLATVKSNSAGNFLMYFDANLFGEAITAPHIRRAPLQNTVISKIFKAVSKTREQEDQPGLLPPGDILVIVDGGRKNSSTVLGYFGMTKDRKAFDKKKKERDGKVVYRQVILTFEESSVAARKFRKKSKNDYLACSQGVHIFWNGMTAIAHKKHLHFSSSSNASDVSGPISLQAYLSLPKLTVKQKKEFWGARRRAVGGRTADDGSEDGEDEEDEEDEAEDEAAEEIQLPGVGLGRGAKGLSDEVAQPVCYQQLPPLVAESFAHAYSALAVLDMTPGVGDFAISSILRHTGYVGICQMECQKEFIMVRLRKALLAAMADPQSKVYAPAFASTTAGAEVQQESTLAYDFGEGKKRAAEDEPAPSMPKAKPKMSAPKKEKETEADPKALPKPKAKAKGKPDLSEKLAQLLARSKDGGSDDKADK